MCNDNTVQITSPCFTALMPAMFVCTDANQAPQETNDCCKVYPPCCIRLAASDAYNKAQVMSFLVRKPDQTAAASPPPSCWAMAGTASEKDEKVWGPLDRKRATQQSEPECTCVPQRTTLTPPRTPGDRASPGHSCGLAQVPLRGPAYFLAKSILRALCPHSWGAKYGKPDKEDFPSPRMGSTKPEGRDE